MLEVRSQIVENGYRLNISRRKEGLFRRNATFERMADWALALKEVHPIVAAAIDDLELAGNLIRIDLSARFLSFAAAAQLPNNDAQALNLLPAFPYQLEIQSRGTLGTDNFQIQCQVTQAGVRVPGVLSEGLFVSGEEQYRISGLLYSILAKIGAVNSETSRHGKLAQFAGLRLLLPDDCNNIATENLLLRIRIAHVTALSVKPSIADGNVSFDPVPMRRKDPEDPRAGAELAITPAASDKFAQEFRVQKDVNSTYALESGEYLFIDPSIRTALRVVKQKQRATLDERIAFLMSPAQAITEAYREGGDNETDVPIGDVIFFETSEYSERITGIGEWIPPQLSYLEGEQNNWLPERFSVVLSGKLVTGKPDDVPVWIEQVKAALSSRQEEVTLGGVNVPTGAPGLLATLQRLQLQRPSQRPRASNQKSMILTF